MKNTYQTFINELLAHGDKFRAYKAAYPSASGEALKVATNRLLRRPEVQAQLQEASTAARAKALASFEESVSTDLAEQFTTIKEKRRILHLMITGQWKTKRCVKLKDRIEEVEEDISPHAMLRAIELDAKLEEWQRRIAAEQEEAQKQEERRQPQPSQLLPDTDPFPKYGTADEMCAWHKRKNKGEGTCRVEDNNIFIYETNNGKNIACHQLQPQPPKLQEANPTEPSSPSQTGTTEVATNDDAQHDWQLYQQHGGVRSNLNTNIEQIRQNFINLSPRSRKALIRPLIASTPDTQRSKPA